MLNKILDDAISYTLVEWEAVIADIVNDNRTDIYPKDTHGYIVKNYELESYIQSNILFHKKFFNGLQKSSVTSLNLITEAWCLDACIVLPLLRGIVVALPNAVTRIYPRDQSETVMQLYLTNGSKSIPIVFGLDKAGQEVFRWGPRSQKASALLVPMIQEDYRVKSKALSAFYKSDLTQSIQEEWIDLF